MADTYGDYGSGYGGGYGDYGGYGASGSGYGDAGAGAGGGGAGGYGQAGGFDAQQPADGYGGGGGYVQGSQGAPGSQSSPQKKTPRDQQTLIPVTIKQLLEATQDHPDDGFKIDQKEVSQVELVGWIVELKEFSTNLTFQIEDGTGRIEVKLWINSGDGVVDRRQTFSEGQYMRITGNLRTFNDNRNVVAFDIRPVTDHNEVTHHMLQVIYVHLFNTKGPLPDPRGGAAAARPAAAAGTGIGGTSYGAAVAGYSGGSGAAVTFGSSGLVGGNTNENMVLEVLKSDTDPDATQGMSRERITAALQGKLTALQIRTALDALTSDGNVYVTIDEDHFRATG